MPGTVIPDIIITAKPTAWDILLRNGLSVTMKMRRNAVVMRKMTGFADNGWLNRNCVLPHVISTLRIKMRITVNGILRPWKPCCRTGMKPTKDSSN